MPVGLHLRKSHDPLPAPANIRTGISDADGSTSDKAVPNYGTIAKEDANSSTVARRRVFHRHLPIPDQNSSISGCRWVYINGCSKRACGFESHSCPTLGRMVELADTAVKRLVDPLTESLIRTTSRKDCEVVEWHHAGPISQRSEVQILPSLPTHNVQAIGRDRGRVGGGPPECLISIRCRFDFCSRYHWEVAQIVRASG